VIARERCSECSTPFLRLRSSEGKYFSTALRLSEAASKKLQSKCCGPEVGNLQTACALQAFYDCFVVFIIIIGSTALRGPWTSPEASASWSIRLLLLQVSWQVLWRFVWWKEQHSRKNLFLCRVVSRLPQLRSKTFISVFCVPNFEINSCHETGKQISFSPTSSMLYLP
jgi:hypothetical protein